MPYQSNGDLPAAVRSRYSDKCQTAFRATWNGEFADHGDESRAFATAHAAAKRCQEANKMLGNNMDVDFKVFSAALTPVKSDDGKLRMRTIASSSVEDLSGDIVTENALREMAASAKGMTIFRNHSYKVPGDILGSVENAFVQQSKSFDTDGKPIHELVLDVVVFDDNPENVRTHKAAQDGVMLGTSIGAMIPRGTAKKNANGGITFDSLKLKEASIVGIPQNPRSWVQYATKALKVADAMPDDEEETNEEFIKAADETDVEKAKVWVTHDAKTQTVTVDTDMAMEPDASDKGESKESGEKKKDAEPEITKADIEETMDAVLEGLDVDWANLPEGDQAAADALYAEYDEIDKAADPELVKAPLTSEARNNLSESQFACPAKRKYPIQDKAHIRAALSRCGDPSNDQCGCDRVKAAARKAGIGDSSKSVEPELVKEAAVVAAASEDETPPAQELEQSVPESAETATKSGEDALRDDILSRSASALADVVKAQNSEIVTLSKQVETLSGERNALTQENRDLKASLSLAKEIVQTIAKTPLGRKAVVADKVSEFEDLEAKYGGIYSPAVLKSLENK